MKRDQDSWVLDPSTLQEPLWGVSGECVVSHFFAINDPRMGEPYMLPIGLLLRQFGNMGVPAAQTEIARKLLSDDLPVQEDGEIDFAAFDRRLYEIDVRAARGCEHSRDLVIHFMQQQQELSMRNGQRDALTDAQLQSCYLWWANKKEERDRFYGIIANQWPEHRRLEIDGLISRVKAGETVLDGTTPIDFDWIEARSKEGNVAAQQFVAQKYSDEGNVVMLRTMVDDGVVPAQRLLGRRIKNTEEIYEMAIDGYEGAQETVLESVLLCERSGIPNYAGSLEDFARSGWKCAMKKHAEILARNNPNLLITLAEHNLILGKRYNPYLGFLSKEDLCSVLTKHFTYLTSGNCVGTAPLMSDQ